MRIEQRVGNTGSDLGVRVRPRIKVTHPLGRGAVELVASHEAFLELNDTDWGQNAGFRRMRNFVGVALPIAKRVGIEIGYLNQYDFVDRGPDRVAHVGSLSVSFGF